MISKILLGAVVVVLIVGAAFLALQNLDLSAQIDIFEQRETFYKEALENPEKMEDIAELVYSQELI